MRPSGAESQAPAVELEGISKRFGYREVLKAVDLTVARGESVAVFGPNGAGKSTLLRIVATLWRPTAGRGRVFGLDLLKEAYAVRARIGSVFHQSLLRPEFTLDENLRLYQELYGIREREGRERRKELAWRLGLFRRLHDPVGTYSQGLLKRADIARSLLHQPDLWLLDEPFSGLDREGRELLEELVRSFASGGGTVVLVTHDHDIGRRLCARRLAIEDGAVVGDFAAKHGAQAAFSGSESARGTGGEGA